MARLSLGAALSFGASDLRGNRMMLGRRLGRFEGRRATMACSSALRNEGISPKRLVRSFARQRRIS
jgi:hypothetical protein